MTSRERLLKVFSREIPDHVPVTPDISNMIPARRIKKPFWDIYLFQDPPLWKAYIDSVKYFGIDGFLNLRISFDDLGEKDTSTEAIIFRNDERIITQKYRNIEDRKVWSETATVYYRYNPPAAGVKLHSIGFPEVPDSYEELTGVKEWPQGESLLKYVKDYMGEHGVLGVTCGTTKLVHTEEQIYDYYDNPKKYVELRDQTLKYFIKRFDKLMSLEVKPDLIMTGYSGTLIHQTPDMFRELGLPIVKKMTALAKEHSIPSHVHSCGPEKLLVKILAEETDLTMIDPLEIPPMGDCNLRLLKESYGKKLVLKGNLHTTNIMLNGSVEDVARESRKAIDEAAEGGGFILSTGDQCGRDTPDENIFEMIRTAKIYGRY